MECCQKNIGASQKKEKQQTSQQLEQHNYIAGLKKYLNDNTHTHVVSPISKKQIDFSVNGSSYVLLHTWKKMMTVGRASDVLICDIQEMLTRFQNRIGFEYIKLCGIFSDDLHVYNEKANGTPVYSFTYIDKILDFVTKLHLNPWIQLSYMPEKLAKYPNKRLFGSNVSQPHSIAAWCGLFQSFCNISATAMDLR